MDETVTKEVIIEAISKTGESLQHNIIENINKVVSSLDNKIAQLQPYHVVCIIL